MTAALRLVREEIRHLVYVGDHEVQVAMEVYVSAAHPAA